MWFDEFVFARVFSSRSMLLARQLGNCGAGEEDFCRLSIEGGNDRSNCHEETAAN